MRHARSRIKKENPEAARQWKEAIKQLSKGDHYILILCNEGFGHVQIPPAERPPHDFLKLLGVAILVAAALVGLAFLRAHLGIFSEGGGKGRYSPPVGMHTSMLLWLQRLLWFLIVGGYLYYVILPWILKKPSPGLSRLFLRLFRRERRSSSRN